MTNAVSQDQPAAINGAEKVAALLLALETDVARRLLKHFARDDLRRIAKVAAGLGFVSVDRVRPLFDELLDQLSESSVDVVGGANKTELLLTGIVSPDDVIDIMSDVRGSSNRLFWRRLPSVSEEALAAYLLGEHPQTIALILSKIDSAYAAKVLGRLPSQSRNAAMRRMLTSRSFSDAALRIVETTLNEDLILAVASDEGSGANNRVAGIINQMERDQMDEVLESISQTEPFIADKLKSLLFSFEDIPRLGARARTVLFDQIPTDRLIVALHGADAMLRGVVLPNLSARTRRMVEAELASGDMPPRKDTLRAQRAISDMVLSLAEQGVIEINPLENGAAA